MTDTEKSAAARLPAAGNWLQRIFSALGRAHARRVAMRELYALDNRLLQDIGIDRYDITAAVNNSGRFAKLVTRPAGAAKDSLEIQKAA